ncbi:isopentenyl-diphosphate Delta-isomerase [Ferruginibacter albus]|uniref:isopentenyl-diphosphate Delta-isomerase n=1 Tax=Ferruginibacter albus TaxID=2875540 RepID=UPI001CC63783|nr:isopentenyl-diphosphate Delta-isomerase [Ferruginibacter albus]UAY51239.1 isopentenyl-diphosphate Delta-isomerase [Ferruginibacter albus]
MNRDNVVLVDKNDNALGIMEKLTAHEQGQLHRAFSVFIFNDKEELLLQQRSGNKYHGAGLWTNTCCSHPQWEEDVCLSAKERLYYEMGLECNLQLVYSFIYKAKVENNLTEHELDYVFIGYCNQNPIININEVQNYKWLHTDKVLKDLKDNPSYYTVWFNQAFQELLYKIGK